MAIQGFDRVSCLGEMSRSITFFPLSGSLLLDAEGTE